MIGSIFALKFFGGKDWNTAIKFCIAYVVLAMVILLGIYYISPTTDVTYWIVLKMVIIVAVFFAIGKFWLKLNTPILIRVFIIAFIIDMVIAFAIYGVLSINEHGVWMWDWFTENMPYLSIAKDIIG